MLWEYISKLYLISLGLKKEVFIFSSLVCELPAMSEHIKTIINDLANLEDLFRDVELGEHLTPKAMGGGGGIYPPPLWFFSICSLNGSR